MSCLLPSLKLECEKLASEKTEMQRHYVMVSGPAGQGSAGQGLALSGNTWTANLNSVCHSGVAPAPLGASLSRSVRWGGWDSRSFSQDPPSS